MICIHNNSGFIHRTINNRFRWFVYASLFCLLLLLTTCKKEFNITNKNPNFQYNPYGLTYIMDVIATKSGDVFILGSNRYKALLTKTTAAGNLLWQKELPMFYMRSLYASWDDSSELLAKGLLIEKKDGTILLFGPKYLNSNSEELLILKLDANGNIIKTNDYFVINKDSINLKSYYSNTSYQGEYTSDGDGGYFMRLSASGYQKNGSSFYGDYFAHYNNKDSMDQLVDIQKLDASYSNYLYEMAGNPENGNLILLCVKNLPPAPIVTVEKFNKQQFLSNSIKTDWKVNLSTLGIDGSMRGIVDMNYYYNYYLQKTSTGLVMTMTKIDLNTGLKVKEWTIPVNQKIGKFSTPHQTPALDDGQYFYMFVRIDNAIYLYKAPKDGGETLVTPIGGNITTEQIIKTVFNGEQIIMFGKNTMNGYKETNVFMCRLDKNGKISAQ